MSETSPYCTYQHVTAVRPLSCPCLLNLVTLMLHHPFSSSYSHTHIPSAQDSSISRVRVPDRTASVTRAPTGAANGLTASTRPFSVGLLSMRASNTSSVSLRTYSRTVLNRGERSRRQRKAARYGRDTGCICIWPLSPHSSRPH